MKFAKFNWPLYYSSFNRKCKFEEKIINMKSTVSICYINKYIMEVSSITVMEYEMFKKN